MNMNLLLGACLCHITHSVHVVIHSHQFWSFTGFVFLQAGKALLFLKLVPKLGKLAKLSASMFDSQLPPWETPTVLQRGWSLPGSDVSSLGGDTGHQTCAKQWAQLRVVQQSTWLWKQDLRELIWMTSSTAQIQSPFNLKIIPIFITLIIAIEKLPSDPGVTLGVTRPQTPVKALIPRDTFFKS